MRKFIKGMFVWLTTRQSCTVAALISWQELPVFHSGWWRGVVKVAPNALHVTRKYVKVLQ